jgi:uncharacterized protein (DUF4415 family)
VPPSQQLVRKKQAITIRLDADIVEWFKQQGGQYQTMINVLRGELRRPHDPPPDEGAHP